MKRHIARLSILLLMISNLSCGYFLYPERVGQKDGRLDPTVIILDAAGLLFGILPGVVSFAVDITTGAIYLPTGEKSAVEKHTKKLSQLDLVPAGDTLTAAQRERLAAQLSQLLGKSVNAQSLEFYRTDTAAQLSFAQSIAATATIPRG